MLKKTFLMFLFFLFVGILIYSYGFKDKTLTQEKVVPSPDIAKPLIVVLSPHFDDGVLSLGGLMAKREHELLVATFFTQRPAEVLHTNWDKISGFSNSDEAVSSRIKENEGAIMPFGTIIKNYDYPDSQYRKENQDKEIRDKIIKDIQSITETFKNREIFIYGPGIFGEKITHPDHKIVHDAFISFSKINKKQNLHFFIYEDFPYIRQFVSGDRGNFNDFLNKQENILFKENPVELKKSELSEKISSIYNYKSQIKAFLSLGYDLRIITNKFFKSRCKNIDPNFYACEVVHSFSN